MPVSPPTRQLLLNLARTAIFNYLHGLQPPPRPAHATADIDAPFGAFVTLHERPTHDLRGCIGVIETARALWETVREAAVSAAIHDPRFAPVQPYELPELHIEISVLSPLARVADVDEIVIGTHGLLIRHGRQSGLLLPQVAPEWGWTRDEFLAHTCRKAGLPMDAWQAPETNIYRFTATIFGEAD